MQSTSLFVGRLLLSVRCVRPFTGYAACSLWCGYRIVYCAIPDRDPSLINVSLFVLVLCHSSRAGYVTYTITAHHNAAHPLLFVYVVPAQVVQPEIRHMLCIFRHTSFAPPAGIHIYRSSLYMFLWQPCGCICRYSRMMAAQLLAYLCHHTTPVSAICTAATVNSCSVVLSPTR